MRRPSIVSLSISTHQPPPNTSILPNSYSHHPLNHYHQHQLDPSNDPSITSYSYSASEYDLRHRSTQLADLALLAEFDSSHPQIHHEDDHDDETSSSSASSQQSISSSQSNLHPQHSIIHPSSFNPQPSLHSLRRSSFTAQSPSLPTLTESTTLLNHPTSNSHHHSISGYGSLPPSKFSIKPFSKLNLLHSIGTVLGYIPAVILGLMMNVLDGVSYGLIMFPTAASSSVFDGLGGIGVSMFFVTCIISQLVFSLGASGFKGGNGSMMIESVPFMHVIANKIADGIGSDRPEAIMATTMLAFAFSSILTGLAFFALGALKLGNLMEFFPRHILVGCIGSVGAFLFLTGLQVTAQFADSIGLNLNTFYHLTQSHILPLWMVPLVLAILLRLLVNFFPHPFFVPSYFILIPFVFYTITSLAHIPLSTLRGSGWVFSIAVPSSSSVGDSPFAFYAFYKFHLVDWSVFKDTLTAQLAMVIFGLLHVPLNVPALSLSLGKDDVDIDRELMAHGLSNTLAGLFGTVSNYLCYINSVLFVRVGGDSRVAGLMLATAMMGLFAIGPGAIAYLPVCVVGALIFLLGIDLVKEAVWDTLGKVSWAEYGTIWAIIIAATWHDFVVGLVVGIVLACVFFVVTVSQQRAIKSVMDGRVARSTVRRHPTQHAFLKRIGSQIRVIKLQGHLFFGTISVCEKTIKQFFDAPHPDPIQHLVLDFSSVATVDFSGGEGFVRIERMLRDKGVVFVICGAADGVATALRSVGLWTRDGVEVFEHLNEALEFCENIHLRSLYPIEPFVAGPSVSSLPSPSDPTHFRPASCPDKTRWMTLQEMLAEETASPRNVQRVLAAEDVMASVGMTSGPTYNRFNHNLPQPTHLLLQTFKPFLPELNEDFWKSVAPCFVRTALPRGRLVWELASEPNCFYLIESGILRATYGWPSLGDSLKKSTEIEESMLPGTVAGDHSFLAITERNTRVVVEQDAVLWRMGRREWDHRIDSSAREVVGRGMLKMAAEEEEVLIGHLLTRF